MLKATYIILKSPQSGKYKAIKCGDSYSACFFGGLWALYHGLFSIFFLNILFYVLFCVIVAGLALFLQLKLEPGSELSIFLICFFSSKFYLFKERGSYWLIKKKIKEGYVITGVVETGNFFKVISLFRQNVDEKRLAKRNLRKLKTSENLLETGKQYVEMELEDFYFKDLKTCRHALLKVKKWKDSELLELCERRFQLYCRNTEVLLKVVFRNIGILLRNIKTAMSAISNTETMTEEAEDCITLFNLQLELMNLYLARYNAKKEMIEKGMDCVDYI